MAAVAAGAAIVGGGIAAYGAIKSAQDEAAIKRLEAEQAYQQAGELDMRERANEALRTDAAFRAKLDFASMAAGTGHEGAGIGSQLEIQRQSDLQNILAGRDEAFAASQLRKGGDITRQLAGNIEEAGYISAAGSLLGAGGRVGSLAAGGGASPGTAQSLPSNNYRPGFTGG